MGSKASVSKASLANSKERLLQTAQELFALVGFQRCTIREICQRAKVNPAMVNYHFGGKAQLYDAVLTYSLTETLRKKHAMAAMSSKDAGPEARLSAFVEGFLSYSLGGDEVGDRTTKLIVREMAEPSPALDALVDRLIRPVADDVEEIVREFLGDHTSDIEVRWYAHSIVGQCLHYRSQRPALERLYPSQKYAPEDVKRLAEHITRFSLGALRAFKRSQTGY